jgi:diguanylate cyclase
MSTTPDPAAHTPDDARRELERVTEQVEAMQALLVRLLQDVVRAESRLGHAPPSTLVEVNQQLVVAAMSSQAEADAAQQALQDAAQTAMLDALTGLPNRNSLRERFTRAAAQARRHGGRCALLFIDLDDFKRLNDTHGHVLGDRVLKGVAERLGAAVREVDTVSRHGGDEFLVLLAELAQRDDAHAVADKLAAAVAEPLDLDGQVVKLTASIGIAVFPEDGEDLDTLVACADTAMYASKRAHHGLPATPAPLPVVARPAQKAADELSLSQRLADLRNANERLILSALDARRLAEAAEQARQRQSALLAAVANELRDPMAPIRIATAMLGRPFADEPLLPRVEQIVALQMRQMSDLMEAVMAAGAVGANGEPASPSGLQLRRQPVELGQIIDAAVADLGPLTEARHQQVEWQRPSVPVDVLGDAPALEQLVVNLLDNASRHTPAGGVIGVNLAQGDGHVDVTVSDEGIGLTPTILPIIFEPFVQDGRTLGTGGIGLGVGLTVAKALAHALGGDIAARSAGHDQGSEFVLTLESPGAAGAQEPV